MERKVCALPYPGSRCHSAAQSMLQCSRTETAQCARSSLNCFSPYYKTTALNKAPATTFRFLSSTNCMIQKILQRCLKYTCFNSCHFLFSSQNLAQSPYGHSPSGSGVSRDACGKALPGRQRGSSNDPSACSPPAHHITAGYPTAMGKAIWKASHTSCEARGTSSMATKTLTWAAKVANMVVRCLFSPPLVSWALLLTLIHLITSITKLHCSRM